MLGLRRSINFDLIYNLKSHFQLCSDLSQSSQVMSLLVFQTVDIRRKWLRKHRIWRAAEELDVEGNLGYDRLWSLCKGGFVVIDIIVVECDVMLFWEKFDLWNLRPFNMKFRGLFIWYLSAFSSRNYHIMTHLWWLLELIHGVFLNRFIKILFWIHHIIHCKSLIFRAVR